jgi:hypothetical protein
MSRRKQEGKSVRTIYDPQQSWRVTFSRNPDGTFGFLEWKFYVEENSWVPTRIGQGSRLGTLDEAIREATGRVEWLGPTLSSK